MQCCNKGVFFVCDIGLIATTTFHYFTPSVCEIFVSFQFHLFYSFFFRDHDNDDVVDKMYTCEFRKYDNKSILYFFFSTISFEKF